MKKSISLLLFIGVNNLFRSGEKDLILRSGKQVTLGCDPREEQVVHTALELLSSPKMRHITYWIVKTRHVYI